MASKSRLAKVTLPTDAEPGTELVTWSCKEGYVYVPIPPAGSAGHRADKWDVDKWFKALKVELVTIGDSMTVRLSDQESGELFADCPLPSDGTPLTTAVEPVVDSSRYFVLRVVDQETGKHAFIGLGFRERSDASGFTTGLDEYRKYLKRKQDADAMKAEYERQENGEGGPQRDYSLKTSITIPLKIGTATTKRQDSEGQSDAGKGRAGAADGAGGSAPSLVQAAGALKLGPPPPSATRMSGGAGTAAANAASTPAVGSGPNGAPGPAAAAAAAPAGAPGAGADEWSDFTGTS